MGDTCSRAHLEKGHPGLLASRPPVFLQVKDGNPNICPWESQQNAFACLRHRLSTWMLVLSSGKVPLAPACGGMCGIELELELGEGGLPPVTPLFPSVALLCSACRHSTSPELTVFFVGGLPGIAFKCQLPVVRHRTETRWVVSCHAVSSDPAKNHA